MKGQTSLCTCVLATAALVACADDDGDIADLPIISGIYDRTVDFDDYQTFDIVEPDEIPAEQTLPRDLLEADRIALAQAIIEEMEGLGYVRDREDPDLEVTSFIRYRDAEIVTEAATWNRYYYGWYWGYAYPWYDRDVVELEAGTLIIDAVDVGEPDDDGDDVLVFRGSAVGLLPQQPTGTATRIPRVVEEIFEHWPDA